MPGPNHNQSGRNKANRHPQPAKPNVSKVLKNRFARFDPASLLFSGHLFLLVSALLTSLFSWRFVYKAGCLVQAVICGVAGWKAYKSGGRKVSVELLKEQAVPYFFLAAGLFYLGRWPLLRTIWDIFVSNICVAIALQLATAVHAVLGMMKIMSSNPGAFLGTSPAMKQQAKQFTDTLKAMEPQGWQFASHLEILAVPWTFVAAIRGQESLLLPVLLLQMVRFLVMSQARMGKAWAVWAGQIDQVLSKAEAVDALPASVKAVLLKTRESLSQKTN